MMAGLPSAKAGTAWVLVTTLLLAGCMGSRPEETAAPTSSLPDPSNVKSALGGVAGNVTDMELRPIANVTVHVKERNLTTNTTVLGFYAFPNLGPGRYTLVFDGETVRRTQEAVTVRLEELVWRDILLYPSPPKNPYEDHIKRNGFLAFTLGASNVAPTLQDRRDKLSFPENATIGLGTVLTAVEWVGTTSYCSLLNVQILIDKKVAAQATRTSPVEVRANHNVTVDPRFLEIKVGPPVANPANPGGYTNVCRDQDFKVYTSLYYNQQAPEGAKARR